MDDDCVFCRIVDGDEDAHVVYEDEETMAFLDVNAAAEGHTLVVPKTHFPTLTDMDHAASTALFDAVRHVSDAIEATIEPDGLSIFQSNGSAAGQDVFHVHVHVLPRWADDDFSFAPSRTRLTAEEGERIAAMLRGEI